MKTLLTIHGVDQSIAALDPVIALAQDIGAHLNVVVMGLVQTVPVAVAPGVSAFYFEESNAELIATGKERVAEIEERFQKGGLSASVTLECRDPAIVEGAILGHSLFADITVLPNQKILKSDLLTRSFSGALIDSGRPVLIMGSQSGTLPPIKKVMFAWNGEPESAKAMHHSLPWLTDAAEAHVVVIDPDEYKTGPNPGDDIAAYLARRKLKVTVDRLPGGHRDTSDVLLEHANDIGADLLVMGAYGHSRFREWLLGGTTREVLEKAKLPVLMAH